MYIYIHDVLICGGFCPMLCVLWSPWSSVHSRIPVEAIYLYILIRKYKYIHHHQIWFYHFVLQLYVYIKNKPNYNTIFHWFINHISYYNNIRIWNWMPGMPNIIWKLPNSQTIILHIISYRWKRSGCLTFPLTCQCIWWLYPSPTKSGN